MLSKISAENHLANILIQHLLTLMSIGISPRHQKYLFPYTHFNIYPMSSSSKSSCLNLRLQVNHSTSDHLLLLTPSLFSSLEKLIILIPKKVCIIINLFHLSTGLDNELLNLDKKNIYEIQKSLLT